ncbi:MAG: hypothetical protein AAF591_22170 [Verrucomicrobiota bacterium]
MKHLKPICAITLTMISLSIPIFAEPGSSRLSATVQKLATADGVAVNWLKSLDATASILSESGSYVIVGSSDDLGNVLRLKKAIRSHEAFKNYNLNFPPPRMSADGKTTYSFTLTPKTE